MKYFRLIITLILITANGLPLYRTAKAQSSSARVIIGEGGAACFFCQKDPQWENGAQKDACRSPVVALNGCGPTTMAMALCAFGIETDPTQMWNDYMDAGYLATCATDWRAHIDIPERYGLSVDETIGKDWEVAENYLDAGWLIIASTRRTSSGHILLITNISDDIVTTNDPIDCDIGEGLEYTKAQVKVTRMWAIKKI